ncbi:MAG: Membrane protein insertion efficiency factor YidD, partial [uncultured Solirubrobacteraceae bacterium]
EPRHPGLAAAGARLPARHLSPARAAVQVPSHLLGLRGAGGRGVRHTARLAAGGLACAALQSLEPRRVRPRLGADPVPIVLPGLQAHFRLL